MSSPDPAARRLLPLRSPRAQAIVGGVLASLMVCTRGQHLLNLEALPSASWAVFFLAGALLRPGWAFPALFVLASLLDLANLMLGRVADGYVSSAYWALAFAYAALWLGGRAYARLHRDGWGTLPRLALAMLASSAAAYLIAKGGFYFLSGRYPDASLAGFVERIPRHYPRCLGSLAAYVALAVLAYAASLRRPGGAGA